MRFQWIENVVGMNSGELYTSKNEFWKFYFLCGCGGTCLLWVRDIWARMEQFRLDISGLFSIHFEEEKNECLETPFRFSFGPSSTVPMCLLLRKIANLFSLKHKKSGRLPRHCYLRGTAQSMRYWRLGLGHLLVPSQPSTFELSPTGMWAPLLSLWWWLSGSCNSLALAFPV